MNLKTGGMMLGNHRKCSSAPEWTRSCYLFFSCCLCSWLRGCLRFLIIFIVFSVMWVLCPPKRYSRFPNVYIGMLDSAGAEFVLLPTPIWWSAPPTIIKYLRCPTKRLATPPRILNVTRTCLYEQAGPMQLLRLPKSTRYVKLKIFTYWVVGVCVFYGKNT